VGRVDRDLVKNLLLGYITSDQNKKLGRPSHSIDTFVDQITIKTPNPKCRLFLKIDL
jgi:hypothetical protein